MSLSFKFIPLTFLNDNYEIKKQIRNTIILKYFFERNSEIVHLEDLITGTQYGYNASALVHGRNKFLRISDITDGKVNWETVPYCNCTDEETYLLFPNDILIARTGGTTGKSFLISEPPALSIYAGYLIRIRANERTNPNFLNLFLNSYVYWSQIVSLNEDNFRPSVNANKLKKLILPKCDETAQNDAVKIANGELINGYNNLYQLIDETLLKYDKLIKIQIEKRNQLELQKALKQSILSEAMQGKLTVKWREENSKAETATKLLEQIKKEKQRLIKEKILKREKKLPPILTKVIPYELPENWTWCRLGEITNYGSSKKAEPQNINDETWVLDLEDIEKESSNIINEVTFKNRKSNSTKSVFKKGDVLYSKLRPYLDKVVVANKEGVCTTEILPLTMFCDVNPFFFMYALKRKDFLDYVATKVGGMKMPRLGTDEGRNAFFPLPPLNEQKVIVEKLEILFKNCDILKNEINISEQYAQNLTQAVLKEAFKIKDSSDSLFEDVNYSLYVAMIHKQIENRLKINYGEVATQKTVFNINAFTDQKIPYNFINSNHGTFSPQLKEDLVKNEYLTKDRKGNREVFVIQPSKEKEVLNALTNAQNREFIKAVNSVLDIYEMSFINKETDKIELLNTVAKLIIDTKSTDLEIIYNDMQKWQIKQNGFKTKAEKFSKTDTKKMISLIENLELVEKLKKFA
ncbi:restriction endonuclease subunit S [Flavobacterium lipolyticum]|uniref:Restriction endonuclease subunit S n=1 Tax=Flavobacterium lipolyticum TaxID=2893754 RepID=A0ABS8M3V7_9FLAO|nr:restriction endonuclease subunit S [Flavobacterium sp. F-126]MCC9018908.1 restriction endonuclease subunit S [Flavobacterium sp. F-126]